MKKLNLKILLFSAMVAAIYFIFTVFLAPLSYGPIQFRFAEIMVLLVFIDWRYSYGLVLGCFLANLFSPFGLLDAILGTSGSLFSVILIALTVRFFNVGIESFASSRFKNILTLYISSLWPVISSFIIALGLLLAGNTTAYWITVGTISLGQFVVITVIGVPIFIYLLSKSSIVRALKLNGNF